MPRRLALFSVIICVLSACSGASDAKGLDALRIRPLNLPSIPGGECPASTVLSQPTSSLGLMLGDALVRPVFGTGATMGFAPPANYGSPLWGGDKVIWAVAPEVRTQALIRGHQLGGPSEVRFTYGDMDLKAEPLPELVIEPPSQTRSSGDGWRDVVTATRVQQPGCYAVQIDTRDRSEILVFQVV